MSELVENSDDVLIHVRFMPNADVSAIDRCPADLSPKVWFETLYENAAPYYRTLANGRGFFAIPASTFKTIVH